MSSSWDEANNFRNEASKSFSQSEAYQHQAIAIKNSAASINANYTQEFVDWLSDQSADNTGGGHIGKQGAAHIIANDPNLRLNYAQRFLAEKNLLPSASSEQTLSPENIKLSYDQDNWHVIADINKDNVHSNMNMFKQTAYEEGLDLNSNKLSEGFNNKEEIFKNKEFKTEQELKISKQHLFNEHDDKISQHEVRSKKNLTGLAAKKGLKHGTDLIPEVIKDVFAGEKQTK